MTKEKISELRERAEKRLQDIIDEEKGLSPDDIRRLIHELHLHQIELEMQNEELLQIQDELQRSRDRYADLYNSIPVGYLTIDDKEIILEENATIRSMLGKNGISLVEKSLLLFINRDDQDIFYLYKRSFSAKTRQ